MSDLGVPFRGAPCAGDRGVRQKLPAKNTPSPIRHRERRAWTPSRAVHTTNGSARRDGPTRAVVFMLVPKGSPLTSPA